MSHSAESQPVQTPLPLSRPQAQDLLGDIYDIADRIWLGRHPKATGQQPIKQDEKEEPDDA